MNKLININYDNADCPTVSGRELHEALEVKTAYKDWFPRMCEYGFTEGEDFRSKMSESTGGRPATDHAITIPMAKELCMLQRSEPLKLPTAESRNCKSMLQALRLTMKSCAPRQSISMNWLTVIF